MKGDVWPKGPWRPPNLLQRGNAKFSWFWHGDPLTPGVAATEDAPALDPSEAPTLPRIPAVVIAATDAERILGQLEGAAAPSGFQGGLPFTYRTGPGPTRLRLDVQMNAGRRVIRNVIGRIDGAREPDRWVMPGTHHDAWTLGGIDPSTAAAVLVEVARSLADLRRSGWQPARSIIFAFWTRGVWADRIHRVRRGPAARASREGRVLCQHRHVYGWPPRRRRRSFAARFHRRGDPRSAR